MSVFGYNAAMTTTNTDKQFVHKGGECYDIEMVEYAKREIGFKCYKNSEHKMPVVKRAMKELYAAGYKVVCSEDGECLWDCYFYED